MKSLKLIYNPVSGNKNFYSMLDYTIDKLQQAGYMLSIYRSEAEEKLAKAFFDINKLDYDAVVAAGGDGTINQVINQLQQRKLQLPLGIIPTGTANDLANHLGISNSIEEAVDIISKGKTRRIDLGKILNERADFFINVCAGGLFANVAHQTERDFKNNIGKLAYYLNGIKEIPNFRAIPLKITTDKNVFEADISLFLILNGSSAGGFKQLGKFAQIDDGVFDFIAIKDAPLNELLVLLLKILQGNHTDDKNIIYLKSSYLKLELLEENSATFHVDIDGEQGPTLPLETVVLQEELEVFVR